MYVELPCSCLLAVQAPASAESCSALSPFPSPLPHTSLPPARLQRHRHPLRRYKSDRLHHALPSPPCRQLRRIHHRNRIRLAFRHIQPRPVRRHCQRLRLRSKVALPRQPRIEVPLHGKLSPSYIHSRHGIPIRQRNIHRPPVGRHLQRARMRPRRNRALLGFSSASFRPTVPFFRSSSTTSLAFHSATNARVSSFETLSATGYVEGTASFSDRSNRVQSHLSPHRSTAHRPRDFPPPAAFRPSAFFPSGPPRSPPETAHPCPRPCLATEHRLPPRRQLLQRNLNHPFPA